MKEDTLAELKDAVTTKEKIMGEAALLFAHKGYVDVSMKEIAERVGIRPSSIYNHFLKKEELFGAIVDSIKDVYLSFYDRMDERISTAVCFKDILDSLFVELFEVYKIHTYFGVCMISCEQFRNKKARDVFNHVYIKRGIEYSETMFNACVEKKWVKPFNTKAFATFFMNNVYVGSLMVTHTAMNNTPAYEPKELWQLIYDFMLDYVEVIPQ